MAGWFVRVRGFIFAALALSLAGCADESDPAYLASLLEDPVETENALEKLRKMLDERLQGQDVKAQGRAVDDFASRATGGLTAAFKRADGNPLVQGKIISIVTRAVPFTTDAGLRKRVLDDIFYPVLDRFKERGEDPAQASLVVDTISSLMKPPAADQSYLDAGQIETVVGKLRDVAASVRTSWGCQDRHVRMQGRESPVADQEQLILSCIQAVSKLLATPDGKGGQAAGVALLLDAMRESFSFQDFFLNRAAADAVDDIAPYLEPDQVRAVAPALVEGLFLQGDFFLFPYARRALVHLAAAGDANREIVVDELLKAVNTDMDPEIAKAMPALEAMGRNERLDLLRLPCGTTLAVACEENGARLREYRDKNWPPGKAACNRGADPDRPGSGFQWGFNYEVIWDKFGNLLVDIVNPFKPGQVPDGNSKVGMAVQVLQKEVALTADWVAQVKADKKLLDALVAQHQDFMETAVEEQPAEGEAAAAAPEPEREPKYSDEAKPLVEKLTALRASEATKLNAEARQTAFDLLALLGNPEVEADDVEFTKELLKAVFTDVQNDLMALADLENEYASVNLRLWRTISAARSLSLLGVTGQDDETLKQVLVITQFTLDNLMGFRISPLRAFPQLTLRFKQRFTPEGMPMVGQPSVPAFIDAIQNYQRPIPEVMNFLINMIAATSLTGENNNATLRAEKFIMMNADVTTFRALATRTFFAIFRRSPALPDADKYLELFNFYGGDVQYLLTLEKTGQADPAFQLYPPIPKPAEGEIPSFIDESPDWLTNLPAKSAAYTFDAYRDPLAQCVLKPWENRAHAAKWRREMNEQQKTDYCKKYVEPWASEYAEDMAAVQIEKLDIVDDRCWNHMKSIHDKRFQYCLDVENQRTPQEELGLTKEECKAIRELDDSYYYCVDLRFLPEYVEQKLPTLWGCYDRFPWLRAREPIGPDCQHIAQRIIAAYLYVKFRSEAGVAAPDGITYDALKAKMTLDELMAFARNFGQEQDEAQFAKLNGLVMELAKVQADFPVFRRPEEDDAVAKTTVRKPEDAKSNAPDFVVRPWYWHDEWIERQPRTFDDLKVTFMDSCRPEEQEDATECAKDGGKLGNQMKVTIEGGQPGPLMEDAAGLAIMLMRQDLVGLAEMRDALNRIETDCFSGGAYNLECVRTAALEGEGREKASFVNPACRGMAAEALGCRVDPDNPQDCADKKTLYATTICAQYFQDALQARGFTMPELNRRMRAVYLLTALADDNRPLVESTIGELLLAVDSDPRFLPPVTFAFQKVRPQCCPVGQQGACDKLGCERLRLFAAYWNSQVNRDTQVPDVDALYYMLLASR